MVKRAAEKIVAVLPAFNEEQVIGDAIDGVRRFVNRIVVVDDGSWDHTSEVAARHGAMVVTHFVNRGQGAALQTGITYALAKGAAVVITFDADGQHEPANVVPLIDAVASGEYDVALGSRYLRRETAEAIPLHRRWLLRLAVLFTKLT